MTKIMAFCEHPLYIKHEGIWLKVPCGKCEPDLINKRNDYVTRMMCESYIAKTILLITLTYQNKGSNIIHYPDFQRWIKKVKYHVKHVLKSDNEIRFAVTAEKGTINERKHFHVSLYNYPFEKSRFDTVKRRDEIVAKQELKELWQKVSPDCGFIQCETPRNMAHVAQYMAKDMMKNLGVAPNPEDKNDKEFLFRSSPKLGWKYVEKFESWFTEHPASRNFVPPYKEQGKLRMSRTYRDRIFTRSDKELQKEFALKEKEKYNKKHELYGEQDEIKHQREKIERHKELSERRKRFFNPKGVEKKRIMEEIIKRQNELKKDP